MGRAKAGASLRGVTSALQKGETGSQTAWRVTGALSRMRQVVWPFPVDLRALSFTSPPSMRMPWLGHPAWPCGLSLWVLRVFPPRLSCPPALLTCVCAGAQELQVWGSVPPARLLPCHSPSQEPQGPDNGASGAEQSSL